VKVLGLPAGRVVAVEPEGTRVRIDLEIDGDVPIPADARAAIVPQSLIGERYVQLVPAWTEGQPRLEDGATIGMDRTTVPVEPDEALQALKEFLDTLDPDGAGRLVGNAADALEGNGESLGSALGGLADLNATLAAKDEQLAAIVDQLDDFTATLVTRESELGEIMELFAEVTGALATERRQVEALLSGLATVSTEGLDLVSANAVQLRTDVARLTKAVQTVEANLGAVDDLLASGDDFAIGLERAFDPERRRIDLRNSFSPAVSEALDTVPGLPRAICVPGDVECDVPVSARAAHRPRRSAAERLADGVADTGGLLERAARALLGVGS
jgi:virulence factor Mce-like protein